MLSEGNVIDNKPAKFTTNAYEKLSEEEVADIRKMIHEEFRMCNKAKQLSKDNEGILYPTFASLHKVVVASGCYPDWSYSSFLRILYEINIKSKKKSEVERILIEDPHIFNWRVTYLLHMHQYW